MNVVVADNLSYRFPKAADDVLREVAWQVEEGSVTLVVGPSGSGKTTLLRCLNGLIPHFHGGSFGGNVTVLGADTRVTGPREFARSVGMVFQDPEAQLVTDRVEDEIVFGMENLGYERRTMRIRLEETLDLLGISHLREREIATLSGGERQRVAIAAALATRPEVLVLDEPTSQLDPLAAHDVLTAVERLNSDLGLTIVIAEHRLDRVLPFADRLVVMDAGSFAEGPIQAMLARLDDVPPLVEFARCVGWQPIPLMIRDARRRLAADWDSAAAPSQPPDCAAHSSAPKSAWPSAGCGQVSDLSLRGVDRTGRQRAGSGGEELLRLDGVTYRYGATVALRDVSFAGRAGEVIALIGRNGSGKTTLLKQINGLLRPARGRVLHRGADIARLAVQEIACTAGYVPQHPTAILHQETLRAELAFTARAQRRQIDAGSILAHLGLAAKIDQHPLDLSGGERQRAALAAIAVAEPAILLLDEPTRGLPGHDKRRLAAFIHEYADRGWLVIVATHDVELVAQVADRVLMLAGGEIVADGSPAAVLAGSLAFGTQMNRLFGGTILTLDDALALPLAAGRVQ